MVFEDLLPNCTTDGKLRNPLYVDDDVDAKDTLECYLVGNIKCHTVSFALVCLFLFVK
jgi:hypothetical protein